MKIVGSIAPLVVVILLSVEFVCSAEEEIECDGKVFVVTKEGVGKKLALVSVLAISKESMDSFVEVNTERVDRAMKTQWKWAKEYPVAMKKLSDDLKQRANESAATSEAEIRKAEVEHLKLLGSEQAKAYIEKRNKERETARKEREHRQELADRKAEEARKEKQREDLQRADTADSDKLQWLAEVMDKEIFSKLPAAQVTAKTDADGSFSLRLPAQKEFFVAARAKRQVGTITELYHWIVRIPSSQGKRVTVTLANDNFLVSETTESLPGLFSLKGE